MLSIIAAGPDNSFKMSLRCVLVAAPVSGSAPHQGYAEDEEDHCGYFQHSSLGLFLSFQSKQREQNEPEWRDVGCIYMW